MIPYAVQYAKSRLLAAFCVLRTEGSQQEWNYI